MSEAGGGRVVVPSGRHETGAIFLKDGVTLELAQGCVLVGSTNIDDYVAFNQIAQDAPDFFVEAPGAQARLSNCYAIVGAVRAKSVALVGKGEIDGRGQVALAQGKGNLAPGRWRDVLFYDCHDVTVEDVTLRNPATWTCYFKECVGVTVRRVTVDSHANHNNDGIDIDAKNVLVEDCRIDSTDDGICLKSDNPNFITENVLVRNCRVASNCSFLKLGTAGRGGFRNCRFERCTLVPCRISPIHDWGGLKARDGITERITGLEGISIESVDGGICEHIRFSDIDMTAGGVQTPIFVRLGRRNLHPSGRPGTLKDVVIERVCGKAASRIASSITGVPGLRVKDVVVRDVALSVMSGGTSADAAKPVPEVEKRYPQNMMFEGILPAYGFYVRHADGVLFENVKLELRPGAEARLPIVADDALIQTIERNVSPESFSVNLNLKSNGDKAIRRCEMHDFGGERRPSFCVEIPWTEKGRVDISSAFPDIDMLDGYPTIDYFVEVSSPCKVNGRYLGKVHCEDFMKEVFDFESNGVCRIRREIGHAPRWASWCDVRKIGGMRVSLVADSWTNREEVLKVWVSDVRFSKEDSWKGTERDARYREWLTFADSYAPDYSDSSCFLEPPQEGRLAKPLKLVENHVAKAEIVAPRDFYNSLELAARDLQYWIEKMTGAKLPIVEAPTGAMPIRVFLNDPDAQRRWKDDVAWLKDGKDVDGYFIHTDGNDIYIGCAVPNDANWEKMKDLGLPFDSCPVGVFRGVIALLENNSTILFASKDESLGTIYDETPDFTVVWGEGRSRPATCGRGWLVGNDTSNKSRIPINSLCMWSARTGGNLRMPHRISGHGSRAGEMIEYVPNKEVYQTFDGENRVPLGYYKGQICLGTPGVLDVCISNGIAKVAKSFEEGYPVVSIGFWNEDNWRVCVCPECTKPIAGDDETVLCSSGVTFKDKMASREKVYRSTQYMLFANGLADGIAAQYPGVKTEILAYLFQRPTPKCPISPNVAWTYCPYQCRSNYNVPVFHPFNSNIFANFTSMQAKGGEMHVYDYHAFCAGGVTAMAEAAAADYRWYSDHGIKMTGAEYASVGNPKEPLAMMNGWLFNQVGWDADFRKVEGLRKYYLRRLYREGAPAAEAYFGCARKWTFNRKGPRGLSGSEAKKLFNSYLGKITNPIALEHYKILMKRAVEGK